MLCLHLQWKYTSILELIWPLTVSTQSMAKIMSTPLKFDPTMPAGGCSDFYAVHPGLPYQEERGQRRRKLLGWILSRFLGPQ